MVNVHRVLGGDDCPPPGGNRFGQCPAQSRPGPVQPGLDGPGGRIDDRRDLPQLEALGCQRVRRRGSSRSRRASPSMLKASTTMLMASPGKMAR
jgi:hypothetical protein